MFACSLRGGIAVLSGSRTTPRTRVFFPGRRLRSHVVIPIALTVLLSFCQVIPAPAALFFPYQAANVRNYAVAVVI